MKKEEKVEDFKINKKTTIKELMNQMYKSGGFQAKNLGKAFRIWKKILSDKKCKCILSFPACIIATGTRGIIREIIKNKFCDIIITTSGTLDHDLARMKDYFHGRFDEDDSKLRKKQINREGNILIPDKSYWSVEDKLKNFLGKIYEKTKNIAMYELIWKLGEYLEGNEKKENSIIYWAYKNKIPIFIPGPLDGSVGYHLWFFYQNEHKNFNINILKDEQKLSELIYNSKKLAAIILGGGISKHHTIWWAQFKNGLDYAIQITSASEYDGSLSGAKLKEAISWNKLKPNAEFTTVQGDVTIILPILYSALIKQ